MADAPALDRRLVVHLHREADAGRWHVPVEVFGSALAHAVGKAFGDEVPGADATEAFLRGLHLSDLALACGCAGADDDAWQTFVETYRPVLYRAADAMAPGGGARDLADGLYAELFGVTDSRVRPSLFRYYHGRSSLATWLRAVLSQRHIDRVRSARRTEPLPDADSPGELAATRPAPAPEHGRFVALMRAALGVAIAALLPQDRLRLSCYYARQMTLAQIGRLLGEHEATVSRHVARSRREIRVAVEGALEHMGLGPLEIDECFRTVSADPGTLDLQQLLAEDEPAGARKEMTDIRSMGGAV